MPAGTASPRCGYATYSIRASRYSPETTRCPAGTATYHYDGAGLRVSKTIGSTTSTFIWDDASTANVLNDGTNSYLYGPDGLSIEQIGASASFWFIHDQVGNTLQLLDKTGATAGSYTPYGLPTHTGTAATPLLYTGQYTDLETGVVYLRARYYDPAAAEFLSLDPLVNVTGTPYAYTDNDPLNGTDRTGRLFGWDNLIGGLIGGIADGAGALVNGLIQGNVNWTDVGIAAASGAVFGAAFTECGICAGAASSFTASVLTQWNDSGSVNWGDAVGEGAVGAFGGIITDGLGGFAKSVNPEDPYTTLISGYGGSLTTVLGGLDPYPLFKKYGQNAKRNRQINQAKICNTGG
ncbi:RHS repeat-associated core domain-containing protein [Amycolatopsis sp. GM8]|uniref:RHS repeat-associated core domain-containing protein n=1 Tax=Amycolatopsis sp. GM8 TaxID=2896530 RepID=UPI001F286732|nr:RHS repeat-associated core domain-containing protein [Amycolatopsis sp. GM8]